MGELLTWFLGAVFLFVVFWAIYMLLINPGDTGVPVGIQFFADILRR